MLLPDYHLQFTFGYQIRYRSVSSGIYNVQKYRVVLGFLKRARAGLRVVKKRPGSNSVYDTSFFHSKSCDDF